LFFVLKSQTVKKNINMKLLIYKNGDTSLSN